LPVFVLALGMVERSRWLIRVDIGAAWRGADLSTRRDRSELVARAEQRNDEVV
jgi:hypothetical protein